NLISVVLGNRFDLRLSRFRGAHYRDFMNLGKGFIDYYFNKMRERLFNIQCVLKVDYFNRR
ncbi:MAG: hypothetical protein ACJAYB_002412, partial [Psychromonas sp.]